MPTPDPVLVEVTRGDQVESVHAGAFVIADASGGIRTKAGDTDRPVYPRSAIKLLQALPLVESGAANRFDFDQMALALACASHNAEQKHRDVASAMLAAAELSEDDLECGPHMPRRDEDAADLHRAGDQPSRLYNNCSGKHAGMLAYATHLGIKTRGYVEPDHQVQQDVALAVSEMTDHDLTRAHRGTDGCSIPTYGVPLHKLAHAFARVADPVGLGETRTQAINALVQACLSEPFMVAGTERFCTEVMSAFKGSVFVKTGAEGVFCGCLPGQGIGFAIKCRDGANRAAEAITAAIIGALMTPDKVQQQALTKFSNAPITNWNGATVGALRPSPDLASALAGAR